MKTILFDLDGTLLSMDGQLFEKTYLGSLIHYYHDIIDGKTLGLALSKSIQAMIGNEDATKTNETVFFETFKELVPHNVYERVLTSMDAYYSNEFDCVKAITSYSPELVSAVKNLKSKGYRVVLATNPLLPRIATNKRIAWAGFSLEDFDHITRFEEYTSSKPSPRYYQEIMERLDLKPEMCIMVGNDIQEDGTAKAKGMNLWIINDDIIDRGTGGSYDWIGTRQELIDKLQNIK